MSIDKAPLVSGGSRPTTELPLVSVIMPAYNAQDFIREAICSVLEQDYPRLELIVVNDGSTDQTAQEARVFGERVRVLEKENGGAAAARNHGISAAQGELVAFLDADDIWLPGKLSAQVGYLMKHPEVGMVTSNFLIWQPEPDGVFGQPPRPTIDHVADEIVREHSGWIYGELLCDCVVCTITVLIRRSVVDSVGLFNGDLRTGEDYEYWLRVSRQTQVTKLNRDFACYRIHAQSTTQVPRPIDNEYLVLQGMLKKFGPVGPDGSRVPEARLADRLFRICFSHGLIHYWRGDPRISRKAFREAIGYVGSRPKAWIYWALALIKDLSGLGLGRR